jgi:hypothetical protein
MSMVPEERIELSRAQGPADFESFAGSSQNVTYFQPHDITSNFQTFLVLLVTFLNYLTLTGTNGHNPNRAF